MVRLPVSQGNIRHRCDFFRHTKARVITEHESGGEGNGLIWLHNTVSSRALVTVMHVDAGDWVLRLKVSGPSPASA